MQIHITKEKGSMIANLLIPSLKHVGTQPLRNGVLNTRAFQEQFLKIRNNS